MKVTLLILTLLLCSCSFFETQKIEIRNTEVLTRDYVDHFKHLGKDYLSTDEITEIKISNESKAYIEYIYNRLLNNNEIIFNKDNLVSFHIIKNTTPFLFSLPGGEYFFSSGLFEKHLKSEELFVAAFTTEIIKSKKNIYEKNILIPLGFVDTKKMIALTRIPLEIKKNINEWSYIVLKRAGFDASAYLNWIQVQNRNSLDFALYLGETVNISREEQAFKSYISKQGIMSLEKKLSESNSSKEYYKLIKDINKEQNEAGTIRKNSRRRTI